jgi:hypothetical protein
MASIITKDTRLHNARQFVEAVSETANTSIYMFLGRPTTWPSEIAPTTPIDNYKDQVDTWDNMEALKRVTPSDVTHVIPRTAWKTGNVYFQYNDSVAASTLFDSNFVVINTEYNVYKCLSNGGGNLSIVEPTGTGSTGNNIVDTRGSGGDGYLWKYMYNINTLNWTKFGTSSFIPVIATTSAVKTDAANTKGIFAYDIRKANVGTSLYSDGVYPITIVGDGSGVSANIRVTSGNISNVIISAFGSNYSVANITSNLGDAVIEPIIAPPDGHGYDSIDECGGVYAMVNVRFEQSDAPIVPVTGFKFRQVGLIKDPFLYGTTNIPTQAGANSLLSAYSNLTVTTTSLSNPELVLSGAVLNGVTSGANATIVSYSGNVINYVQSRTTSSNILANYRDFTSGETVRIGSSSIGVIYALGNATVQPKSGEIIYVDNRNVIARASDQVEDVYVVLEF